MLGIPKNIYLNVRSMKNKMQELEVIIMSRVANMFLISEPRTKEEEEGVPLQKFQVNFDFEILDKYLRNPFYLS